MRWEEAPVYTRCYDLARYLMERTQRFPKHQRFILGARIQSAALDLVEAVAGALPSPDRRAARLDQADDALTRLRIDLRLARDLGLLPANACRHAADELASIGRMVGGWKRNDRPSHAQPT